MTIKLRGEGHGKEAHNEQGTNPESVGMAKAHTIPLLLYILLTAAAANWPDHYAWLYSAVVGVVAIATFRLLRGRGILLPHRRVIPGVIVGLVGIGLWIGICGMHPEQSLAEWLPSWLVPEDRVGFNPFDELSGAAAQWGFIVIRVAGLALLVPVVEEVFWRGFLSRWLIAPEWESVELGRFTATSFAGVTLFFTAAHPEWFAAAVYCALLNGLLIWKRDLWNCIVAHGVSNVVLAAYVVSTGEWWLW